MSFLITKNRIKYFAPADYTEGSTLDNLVKAIIIRTASNEALENIHYECKKEQVQEDAQKNYDENRGKRLDLIISLDASKSFETTHIISFASCLMLNIGKKMK